jgi:hypothetical protein
MSRWFANSSPFNSIALGPTHPDSDAMIKALERAADWNGFAISVKEWSVPVYQATSSTFRQAVRTTEDNFTAIVPVPSNARPDPSSDAHLSITDGRTYWSFIGAKVENGKLSSQYGCIGNLLGSGLPDRGTGRGAGFAPMAGLIRPGEFQAGEVPHALSFACPYVARYFVPPAIKTDGGANTENGQRNNAPPLPAGAKPLPEGARVFLDYALDLSGYPAWQRWLGKALKIYGMLLSDVSGSLTLFALNPQCLPRNQFAPYWGDDTYAYLPREWVSHMRVAAW